MESIHSQAKILPYSFGQDKTAVQSLISLSVNMVVPESCDEQFVDAETYCVLNSDHESRICHSKKIHQKLDIYLVMVPTIYCKKITATSTPYSLLFDYNQDLLDDGF